MREEKRKNAMKLMDESRRKTRGVKFDSVEVVRSLRDTFSFLEKKKTCAKRKKILVSEKVLK